MPERRFSKMPVGLRKRDDGTETIVGYAAVFYNENDPGSEYAIWDDMRERIMPGCFDRAIREGQDCRALFNHDADNLLGRAAAGTLALSVDGKGLRYEITPADTTCARDVLENLRAGNLSGSSFSFIPRDTTFRELRVDGGDRTYIREVNDVDLIDVGPVTYPAYESTTAGLRAAGGDLAGLRQELEEWRKKQGPPLAAKLAAYRARAVEVQ